MLVLLFVVALAHANNEHSSQTQSIVELYKRISEKGSLTDGLSLNAHAQTKLKTINTIRLVPLPFERSAASLLFRVNLSKIQNHEEVKLIEFRLKVQGHVQQEKFFVHVRQGSMKRRTRPEMISTEGSDYLSYDLTEALVHNASQQTLIVRRHPWLVQHLSEASLIIYSRVPGVFLLPKPNVRSRRSVGARPPSGPCSKHDLFVDFDQFSFGAWVVEPKRFNAGVCRGDCPNPLSRLFYPSNHAMLLSLLHDRGNTNQQPSCVPVRLRPLDLLSYDRRELVIKRHQGMQVEECGCR